MSFRRWIAWAALWCLLSGALVHGAERTVIPVLDASVSMGAAFGETTRMAAARSALTDLIGALPETTPVGLVIFGGQRPGDCSDISVRDPAGADGRADLVRAIDEASPTGMSPLASAIRAAADQLDGRAGGGVVILLADGPDTCLGEPGDAVRTLRAEGIRFTLHVIGLAVSDTASLESVAEAGGGRYLAADDPAALRSALARAAGVDGIAPPPPADGGLIAGVSSEQNREKTAAVLQEIQRDKARRKPAAPSVEGAVQRLTSKVSRGRVRAGPSLTSEIRFHLRRGETVSVLGVRGDWNQIRTAGGREGWAHYSLFSEDVPSPKPPAQAGRVIRDIRVDLTPAEAKITFLLDGRNLPKIRFAEGTAEVICDFNDTRLGYQVSPVMELGDGPVRAIRTGVRDETGLRVVLGLAPGRRYRLQHFFFSGDHRYMLIVRPTSPADG